MIQSMTEIKNLHDVEEFTLHEASRHGLEWVTFEWLKSSRTLGQTRTTRHGDPHSPYAYYTHVIGISLPFARICMSPKYRHEIADTIYHEIAHALTPFENHGPGWQKMCRSLGAQPKEFKDVSLFPRLPRDWRSDCVCGQWVEAYELDEEARSTRCDGCGGRFTWARNPLFDMLCTMP